MSSRTAFATTTGLVRKRNEDAAYIGHWLCAVADGMGGHAAGDVASATVIEAIRPFDIAVNSPAELTGVLGHAVRRANERMAERVEADPSTASMGSTLTAMLWSGSHVAIANIGDSRGYRMRNGKLVQVTEDHILGKLVAEPKPAEIGEYLVRFLDARPDWSPDLTVRVAQAGDRYLLCSDGRSSFVAADVMRDVLADISDLDQAVATLVERAMNAGGPDNVTVVAVDVPEGVWEERADPPVVLGSAASVAGAS